MSEPIFGSPTRVRTATDADASRWNTFVNLCPNANFYQRFEWALVNRDALGHEAHFLLAERGDEVVGVLPLVRVRSRLFGDILASMPFVNYGGVAGLTPGIERSLVDAACARADELGCDYLQLRTDRAVGDHLPTTLDKVSFVVDLDPDPEAVMRSFSRKHQKNIRRAQKNEISIRAGGAELLGEFFEILSLSWRGLGTPLYQRAYFEDMLRKFGDSVRIFVAYAGGAPIATAWNGIFRDSMEGLWAGVDPRAHELDPNYVLYWEMIREACERGFRHFRLGRSTKDSGAMRFKEKWSAQPHQLYWHYHLVGARSIPQLNPHNPKYALAIRTWRRLPLGVLRVVGPPIARLIP